MRLWLGFRALFFLLLLRFVISKPSKISKIWDTPHGIPHVDDENFNASVWGSGKHTVLVFFYTKSPWCVQKNAGNRCEALFEYYKALAQKLNYTEVGFYMMECIDIEGDQMFFDMCSPHIENVQHFPHIKYFNEETGLMGEDFPGLTSGWSKMPDWVETAEMIVAVKEDILRTPRAECDIFSKDHCTDEEISLIKYFKPKSDTVINTKIGLIKTERDQLFVNQSQAWHRYLNRDVEKLKEIDEKIKIVKMIQAYRGKRKELMADGEDDDEL